MGRYHVACHSSCYRNEQSGLQPKKWSNCLDGHLQRICPRRVRIGPPWVPELVIIAPSVWIDSGDHGDLSSRIQVFKTWRSNLFCHALDGCFAQTLMAAGHRVHILVEAYHSRWQLWLALPSRLFHPNETLSPISIAVSHKWNPWNPFTRPFMAAPFHPVSNDVT